MNQTTTTKHPENVFAHRMKEMRLRRDLSQRELGIRAGIDEGVASTRINRYEVGVHAPDYLTARRISQALEIPLAYLYCEDENLAKLITGYAEANSSMRKKVLAMLMDS